MISLTSTAQGVTLGARQGRSRALRAYQASTGSVKDVDMMLPRVRARTGRRVYPSAPTAAASSRAAAAPRTRSCSACSPAAWHVPGAGQGHQRGQPGPRLQTGPLGLGAQDGGERLTDVLHLLHLHQVGKAVGALQGRS